MKEKELESVNQHQNYLDILHRDIDTIAKQTLELVSQLKAGQVELSRLVKEYQWERYNRQIEIWAERGLTRCTNCFDIPKRNWGVVPLSDVRFVSIEGDHWHTRHEDGEDYRHTHLWFHRLCDPCYIRYLKDCAASKGGLTELTTETLNQIDEIITTQKGYEADEAIKKRFGRPNNIRVYWHRLPIPEQAYEIGKPINLDDD